MWNCKHYHLCLSLNLLPHAFCPHLTVCILLCCVVTCFIHRIGVSPMASTTTHFTGMLVFSSTRTVAFCMSKFTTLTAWLNSLSFPFIKVLLNLFDWLDWNFIVKNNMLTFCQSNWHCAKERCTPLEGMRPDFNKSSYAHFSIRVLDRRSYIHGRCVKVQFQVYKCKYCDLYPNIGPTMTK